MEDIMIAKNSVCKQQEQDRIRKTKFAELWTNSISGDEFLNRAHQHIKELYARKNVQ